MYAVIFRAKVATLDERYAEAAKQLRELALQEYGCLEFVSLLEGDQEIAISYWENQEQIRKWKNDPRHVIAQESGKTLWYESYHVQVTEIVRAYGS